MMLQKKINPSNAGILSKGF